MQNEISINERYSAARCNPIDRIQMGYQKKLEIMCEQLGFSKEYLIGILNTRRDCQLGEYDGGLFQPIKVSRMNYEELKI